MKTIITKQRLVALGILVVLGAIAVLIMPKENYAPLPEVISSNAITVTGTFICLESDDTTMVGNDECVPGIMAEDGVRYGVDVSQISESTVVDYDATVVISGDLTPIEAISSEIWQYFGIAGIIQVFEVRNY